MKPPIIEENFIDKAIKFVAPVMAQKRMMARTQMALAGSFVGARTDKRQTSQWTTSRGDADSDIITDLPTLRTRSRDLERNAPLATGAIHTVTAHTVGTGLKFKSQVDRTVLNMTDEEADAWESNTQREFRLWAESPDCDAARTLNFFGHQELAFRSALVNGDHLVGLPRIPRKTSPYSLALQHIEADRLMNEKWQSDKPGLVAGVEKDEFGAPTAYHICDQHPGARVRKANLTWTKVPAYGSRTGLKNIIHLFKQTRAGQTRGVPYLAPVIESLKQLDKYTEAELMAAVVTSMLTVFVKTDTGDLDYDTTSTTGETGSASTDTDIKLGSGAIVGLAPGESIETVNPLRPNAGFDPFVMAILRQIGVALELPFEVLIKHFTASYSASRAALMEAWVFFRCRRKWLIDNFCQPIYEVWLYEAVISGRVSAPGFLSDPLVRKAYSGAAWTGDAPIQIDPVKEIEAAKGRVALTVSTIDEETAFLTGGDHEVKRPKIRSEVAMFKELGLKHPAMDTVAPSSQASPPEGEGANQDKTDMEGK